MRKDKPYFEENYNDSDEFVGIFPISNLSDEHNLKQIAEIMKEIGFEETLKRLKNENL